VAVLHSNIPFTKETEKETILELFSAEGSSFSILDKTSKTYYNENTLFRNFNFVKKPFNEYQVQLMPVLERDGTILGFYKAEGYDFAIHTAKEPIFKIEKHNIDVSLKGFYNKDKQSSKITVGLFFPGTIIRYKINGVPYEDVFTKDGWQLKRTPESVSDVAKDSFNNVENTDENIAIAQELMESGEISKSLFERYKIFILGFDEHYKKGDVLINTLTDDEVKTLKEKGLK
jgi:hypothetical protein